MIFKRKIYDKLLQWKEKSAGEKAILIEGARRIGKSTIAEKYSITSLVRFMDKFKNRIGNGYVIHLKNLSKKDNILYIPSYMTFCL